MKNINVLLTDKPSRLYLGNNGNFVFGMIQTSIQSKNDDFTNQNIYITSSNEEIRKNDWVLFKFNEATEIVRVTTINNNAFETKQGFGYGLEYCKKIILTTDQGLDGVQTIDDEFLQWFVKNPSCEWVEVVKDIWGVNYYKIIIPKEEPKQENCCTPIGKIKRYVDCKGCDRKPNKLNLTQLSKNVDDALDKETKESMSQWLKEKRAEQYYNETYKQK